MWDRHSRNRCYYQTGADPHRVLRCSKERKRKRDEANIEQGRFGRQGCSRMGRQDCTVSHHPIYVA